jgi:cytochrome c oxidase assembly protein subunit 15
MTALPHQQAPRDRAPSDGGCCRSRLIAIMVLVGGATRLTESGLSIVEWKPVTGALPPLDEEQWTRRSRATRPFRNIANSTPA